MIKEGRIKIQQSNGHVGKMAAGKKGERKWSLVKVEDFGG
jgi:hypothetical protein